MIDYFCGIKCLESRIINTVGNHLDRFYEDLLRILRAIRFTFNIDKNNICCD